jgi:pSer/pThr/pTyr-binding forkhead associated (FHA) protein
MSYLRLNHSDLPIAKKLQAGEKLMDVTLQVRLGPILGRGMRVPVGQTVKVGRSLQSDIAFPNDAYMSRTHFSLDWDGGACWITDLDSRHGTFVNGKRVQKALLRDGDTVWAGVTVLVVQLHAHDSAAPIAA